MSEVTAIVEGWRPGALGGIVALHGRYYAADWGFGPFFEAKVARELADFLSNPAEPSSQLWLVVNQDTRCLGSIVVDGGDRDGQGRGHLRWFILDEDARGCGLGARLLDHAVAFGRDRSLPGLFLWTFAGLDAARRLYESRGFVLAEECRGETWGRAVTEQRFTLDFSG